MHKCSTISVVIFHWKKLANQQASVTSAINPDTGHRIVRAANLREISAWIPDSNAENQANCIKDCPKKNTVSQPEAPKKTSKRKPENKKKESGKEPKQGSDEKIYFKLIGVIVVKALWVNSFVVFVE